MADPAYRQYLKENSEEVSRWPRWMVAGAYGERVEEKKKMSKVTRKPKLKEPPTREQELAFQPHQFAYEYFGRLPSAAQRIGEAASRPDDFHTAAVVAFRKSKAEVRRILLDNIDGAC